MNIKRLMDLGAYRGLRHRRGLPVRGRERVQMPGQERVLEGQSWEKEKIDNLRKEYGKSRKKEGRSKREKKNVPSGIVHIQSTFNNTIMTITDTGGNVIAQSSAGRGV